MRTLVAACTFMFFSVYTIFHLYFGPGYMMYVHKNIRASCIIPEVDPFDREIMKFFWRPDPIVCSKDSDLVYFDYESRLHINRSRVGKKTIKCNYQAVNRKNGEDIDIEFGPETWFDDSIVVKTDIVKVKCLMNAKMIYHRLHFQVHRSETISNTNVRQPKYNILVFGMDSVSRLAAIRELPKTMAYLEKTLGAYTLKGYTKVGDNTLPNVVPILTGEYAFSEKFPVKHNKPFDNHPFIWNNISKMGGATMFLEDWPRINTFNLGTSGGGGFRKPPTTHYMRPFYLAVNRMELFESPVSDVLQFFEDKNVKLSSTSYLCYGDKTMHGISIEYFKRFLIAYRNDFKFTWVWSNKLSHNYVNFIKLADNDLLDMMTFLKEEGFLKNSFLFFISDHGSRLDKIRNSPVGRIEERLPMMSIVVPDELKVQYPHLEHNLKTNVDRLTCPFDLHETLVDILHETFQETKESPNVLERGISLFRSIPKDRSCADAGIDEHNCMCYSSVEVNVTQPIVTKLSSYIMGVINKLTSKEKCAVLSVKNVLSAKRINSQLGYDANNQNKKPLLYMFYRPKDDVRERYQLLLQASPSDALFEVTVEQQGMSHFSILGTISRTNMYGNQSHCVTESELKKLCYCI